MATHSSVLAWRIPEMGSHRVGHNWSDLAVAAAFPSLKPVGLPWRELNVVRTGNVLGPEASQPQAQQEETDSVLMGQSPSKVASSPTPLTQGHTQTSTNRWRAPHYMRQVTSKGGLPSRPDPCRQSDPCDSLVLISGDQSLDLKTMLSSFWFNSSSCHNWLEIGVTLRSHCVKKHKGKAGSHSTNIYWTHSTARHQSKCKGGSTNKHLWLQRAYILARNTQEKQNNILDEKEKYAMKKDNKPGSGGWLSLAGT